MSYGASAFPPVWKNIIGYDKPSLIRPYEKRMNADELALSLRETISRGLVLYMPFVRFISHRPDTITKVFDRSPFGNHGTIHGAVWQTLPSGKSALSFDGVDDYVKVPETSSLDFTRNDNYTVLLWAKVKPLGKVQQLIVKGLDDRYPYKIEISDQNALFIAIWDGTNVVKVNLETIVSEHWVFCGLIKNGDSFSGVLNGEIVDTKDISGIGEVANNENVYIGTRAEKTVFFNGTIDEVRIYSRALSKEEIRRLYYLEKPFFI